MNIKDPLDPKWSALIQTVFENAIETCQLLVSAGADVNATQHSGDTPLHLAAFYKKDTFKLSQILISGGANPNAKSIQGLTPLHWAVRGNDLVNIHAEQKAYPVLLIWLIFCPFQKTRDRKKPSPEKNSRQILAKNSGYWSHLNISSKKLKNYLGPILIEL